MLIILIILLSIVLFKNSFSIYFFQDDWFLLYISKIKSIGDFLNFFIPRSDVQFYRPLSHETFYFLGRSLFGLNPLGYHLIVWLVFIFNVFLMWKLSQKFITTRYLQLFLVFLYATSAIHYNSLYWIVNFSYILVAFWYFAGFLLFLNKANSRQNNFLLIIIYILGLFSNEFMITFPILIIGYQLIIDRVLLRKNLRLNIILVAVTLFYLILRFILFPPNFGTYQFAFDKSILSSYRWFTVFFLNWPETMKDQMINFYTINPGFLQSFQGEVYIFLTNLAIFFFAFILLPLTNLFKDKRLRLYISKNHRKIFFALSWFIVTLVPIILIPSNISPHQGTIALFGFLLMLIIILESYHTIINRYLYIFLILIFGISWIFSSYTTFSLNDKIHWIKRRSDLSKYWITKIKSRYATLPANSVLRIPKEDKELIVALNDGRGIQEIYGDDRIKVIFSTQSSKLKPAKVVP